MLIYRFLKIFRLIEITAIENTKFKKEKINNNSVSFDESIIRLNYPELFLNNNEVYFQQSSDTLLMWQFKKRSLLNIPEGYLLSKVLKDGFHLFETDGYDKILIIKNSKVEKEIFDKKFSEHALNILAYANDFNIIRHDILAYENLLQQSEENFNLNELLYMIKVKFNLEKTSKNMLGLFIRPVFIATLIISIYLFIQNYRLNSKYEAISQNYKNMSSKKINFNSKVSEIEGIKMLYDISSKLLNRKKSIVVYTDLVSLLKEERLTNIKIDKYKFKMRIHTDNVIALIEKMGNIKYLHKIKIVNNNRKEFSIEGEIE